MRILRRFYACMMLVPGTPLLAATTALLVGCSEHPTGLEPDPNAEISVLFVGNSLTYVNSLPELVQTAAEAGGHTLAAHSAASPNFSLEDHWHTGIATVIRDIRPDVVVMQQGPSSLPENQIYLREWADTLSTVIEEVGARPALLMVWPDKSRLAFFGEVRDSYREAALAVGGMFIPAGQAWLEAWERDPDLALYGVDDFHPSRLGSAVAALVVYRILFDQSVTELPDLMEPTTPHLPVIDLGAAAATVKAAVEEAVREWGVR